MLRFADQAINDMERALEKLGQLREMYGDNYPDYKAVIEAIGLQQLMTHDDLIKFRQEIM